MIFINISIFIRNKLLQNLPAFGIGIRQKSSRTADNEHGL